MSDKKKTEPPTIAPDVPLSQLLLSVTHDKYRMVSLATRWVQEIRQRDQSTLQPQELMAQAMREILAGKVTLEDIEKLPPPPKPEKKEFEFPMTLSLKENGETSGEKAPPPAD